MKRFIGGSQGLVISAQEPWDPRSLGVQLPNLSARVAIALCSAFDRMLARMPKLYDVEEGSNIYNVIDVEAQQLCKLYEVENDIQDAHWVDTASAFSLDAIGSLLGTVRRSGETDSEYRERLKTVLPTTLGGGTIPHLKKILYGIFNKYGIAEADIVIGDGYLRDWHGPDYEFILPLDGDALDYEGAHNGVEVGVPVYDDARFADGLTDPTDANYIYVPDHVNFDTDSFSAWAWFKPTNVTGTKIILMKADGTNIEWYLRLNGTNLETFVNLVTTDVSISTPIMINKTYFALLSYDNSTKQVSLYVVEDGLQGRVIALTKVVSSAGGGARVLFTNAHIYAGKNPGAASQYFVGFIDHIGYVVSAVTDKVANELAYAAPGLDHYAHFNITILGPLAATISIADWVFAYNEVWKAKAAGVEFEGFSNGPQIHEIEVADTAHRYHHTEITETESLNITHP